MSYMNALEMSRSLSITCKALYKSLDYFSTAVELLDHLPIVCGCYTEYSCTDISPLPGCLFADKWVTVRLRVIRIRIMVKG